jgi:uncharacterized membrane protein
MKTLTLADAMAATEKRPGTTCTVATILAELTAAGNDTLAAEIGAATRRPTTPLAAIYRGTKLLKDQGVLTTALTEGVLGRHRNNKCLCP